MVWNVLKEMERQRENKMNERKREKKRKRDYFGSPSSNVLGRYQGGRMQIPGNVRDCVNENICVSENVCE